MTKKITFYGGLFILLVLVNLFFSQRLYGSYHKSLASQKILDEISNESSPQNQFNLSVGPFAIHAYATQVGLADNRTANLKAFFRSYNSPLYDYADRIINVSDKYHFDYRLLPAIAMQESNLCRVIPADSYNCWGWGIYGDTVTRFNSYEDAIDSVAKGIKEQYLDKGLLTASAIMSKYTPSSNGSWANGVNTFLNALE